ncbi:MAG: sugar transporter [Bacteroidaceae bacterium]|nr:sugar transporter [Bacteroidaceae bacterium]
MSESRVHKSLLNAKVNLVFYFLSLFFSFYSRKIFLECLGDNFIGLTGTLGNILGYLNLAELGIGSCISFFLYKPLQCGDRGKIEEILSVFGYLYRKIGLFILFAGCAVSLCFPWIFREAELGMGIIYFSFFSFLGSSLIGYFINYRQILLQADQKNYLVAIYFQSAGLVKTALQIFLAYTYRNLYVWVAIEFLFGILGCIILNWKINKEYPWLHTNIKSGKVLVKQYSDIMSKTKQVFLHKMKDFLLRQSDELFVYAFVSLKMVAYYGNYTILTNKLTLLMNLVLDGVSAGVGNLVAEGNKQNTMKVFWELMAVRYFITGGICYILFFLATPFISLWLGTEYVMGDSILILLLVYSYLLLTNGVVYMFLHAHGLYGDVWATWCEMGINVLLTLIAGSYWGIEGILVAKITSTIIILVLWKPYYLFKNGLKENLSCYWIGVVRYISIFIITFCFGRIIKSILPINPFAGWTEIILYGVILIGFYLICTVPLLYYFAPGFKGLFCRFLHKNSIS